MTLELDRTIIKNRRYMAEILPIQRKTLSNNQNTLIHRWHKNIFFSKSPSKNRSNQSRCTKRKCHSETSCKQIPSRISAFYIFLHRKEETQGLTTWCKLFAYFHYTLTLCIPWDTLDNSPPRCRSDSPDNFEGKVKNSSLHNTPPWDIL